MAKVKEICPTPPFVWPEPRVLAKELRYKHRPPIAGLVREARSIFGIVCSIDSDGIALLESWLGSNPELCLRLVVTVYPTCATTPAGLDELLRLVEKSGQRLDVHMYALPGLDDRAMSTLCIIAPPSSCVYLSTGPSENLGLDPRQSLHLNLVLQPDAATVEAFRKSFDWLWSKTIGIRSPGATRIPKLVHPSGASEAAAIWREYEDCCTATAAEERPEASATLAAGDGSVGITSTSSPQPPSPTGQLGLEPLDEYSEKTARLYGKGSVVSINKLTRMPPLDAPIDPRLFGDDAELNQGSVTRKVSMRVSIIDEKRLKEINKLREGVRDMISRFTFALAENMRWIPHTAREELERALQRMSSEGTQLIALLLKDGVDQFIEARREALVRDIQSMYERNHGSGVVPDKVIVRVTESIRDRLNKAKSGDLLPSLSYGSFGFDRTESPRASPWSQACLFLSEIAAFPRRARIDPFFCRGLRLPQEEFLAVMNVADDAMYRNTERRDSRARCEAELDLLERIKGAEIDGRHRCELIWRMIEGEPEDQLRGRLSRFESQAGQGIGRSG